MPVPVNENNSVYKSIDCTLVDRTTNTLMKYPEGRSRSFALLPQHNEVNTVTEISRDTRGPPLPTAGAVEEFRQLIPKPILDEEPEDGSCVMYGGFIQRC